jgi:hypothetical protein
MVNTNYYGGWHFPLWVFGFLPVLMVWSLIWKGLALWRAAHNDSKPWFIALLLINTVGILEILYLFVFSKGGCGKSCCGGDKKDTPTGTQPTASA